MLEIKDVTVPLTVYTSLVRQSERLQTIERFLKEQDSYVNVYELATIGGFEIVEETEDGV